MTPAGRSLPQSFAPCLDLSSAAEVLALLDLVRAARERRGFVVAVAARKIPQLYLLPCSVTGRGCSSRPVPLLQSS